MLLTVLTFYFNVEMDIVLLVQKCICGLYTCDLKSLSDKDSVNKHKNEKTAIKQSISTELLKDHSVLGWCQIIVYSTYGTFSSTAIRGSDYHCLPNRMTEFSLQQCTA